MAWERKYYYNRNRTQVSIKCVGTPNKVYYLPPRVYTYVKEALANDFTLPKGVLVYDCPNWWQETDWPWKKPWETE